MTEHPMQPTEQQIREWARFYGADLASTPEDLWRRIANSAYAAGADAELEACVEWASSWNVEGWSYGESLRSARRPKPPNLKQQALEALDAIAHNNGTNEDEDAIRRALEALPDA